MPQSNTSTEEPQQPDFLDSTRFLFNSLSSQNTLLNDLKKNEIRSSSFSSNSNPEDEGNSDFDPNDLAEDFVQLKKTHSLGEADFDTGDFQPQPVSHPKHLPLTAKFIDRFIFPNWEEEEKAGAQTGHIIHKGTDENGEAVFLKKANSFAADAEVFNLGMLQEFSLVADLFPHSCLCYDHNEQVIGVAVKALPGWVSFKEKPLTEADLILEPESDLHHYLTLLSASLVRPDYDPSSYTQTAVNTFKNFFNRYKTAITGEETAVVVQEKINAYLKPGALSNKDNVFELKKLLERRRDHIAQKIATYKTNIKYYNDLIKPAEIKKTELEQKMNDVALQLSKQSNRHLTYSLNQLKTELTAIELTLETNRKYLKAVLDEKKRYDDEEQILSHSKNLAEQKSINDNGFDFIKYNELYRYTLKNKIDLETLPDDHIISAPYEDIITVNRDGKTVSETVIKEGQLEVKYLRNYANIGCSSMTHTNRVLCQEEDGHANNAGPNGKGIDGDMTYWQETSKYKEMNPVEQWWRKPSETSHRLTSHDIDHFPRLRDANPRFDPCKQTIFSASTFSSYLPTSNMPVVGSVTEWIKTLVEKIEKNNYSSEMNKIYQQFEFLDAYRFNAYLTMLLRILFPKNIYQLRAELSAREVVNWDGNPTNPAPRENLVNHVKIEHDYFFETALETRKFKEFLEKYGYYAFKIIKEFFENRKAYYEEMALHCQENEKACYLAMATSYDLDALQKDFDEIIQPIHQEAEELAAPERRPSLSMRRH